MRRDVLIALSRGGVYSGGEGLGSMVLVVRRVIGHHRMRTLVVVMVGGRIWIRIIVVVRVAVVLMGVAVHAGVSSGSRTWAPAEWVERRCKVLRITTGVTAWSERWARGGDTRRLSTRWGGRGVDSAQSAGVGLLWWRWRLHQIRYFCFHNDILTLSFDLDRRLCRVGRGVGRTLYGSRTRSGAWGWWSVAWASALLKLLLLRSAFCPAIFEPNLRTE